MFIAIVIISIFAITGFIWILNKFAPFKICSICAGVSGTWLWLITAIFLDYQIDAIFPAVLMGGSVVGITYQIERKLPLQKSPILFKMLFIPSGFIAVYSMLLSQYLIFLVTIIFLIALSFLFLKIPNKNTDKDGGKIEELEKNLKNCC